MSIEVEKVTLENKFVLSQLIQLYHYDFSEFTDDDVNEFGLYDYKYLELYWTEVNRFPFFIKVDGKYAGFVLVRKITDEDLKTDYYSMAEFFVMKKYRKMGVGRVAAESLFDTFKGKWEASVVEENVTAHLFWKKVISHYSNGNYIENFNDFDDSIFLFESTD